LNLRTRARRQFRSAFNQACKSTDQAGAGDKSEFVERQLAHAHAYATRKGWTVADVPEQPRGAHARGLSHRPETIRQDLLRRDVLEATIRKAVALLSPSPADADRRREALQRRLGELTQELERLAVAIARGGDIPELLHAITDRRQQQRAVQDEVGRLDRLHLVNWTDVKRAQQGGRARLAGWRDLLYRQPDEARGILRELLVGRLAFTPRVEPTGRWYEITGQGSLGRLLTGMVSPRVVTPAGFEPAISTLKGSARRQ
jgi:hypothetical protein